MGFVLLGLATASVLGVSGAGLPMFSHGVIGALLFAVAGRMVYRRTHTRDLDALSGEGTQPTTTIPPVSVVVASTGTIGHPGFYRVRARNHDPDRPVEN